MQKAGYLFVSGGVSILTNQHTEYEKLVTEIYQAILEYDGFDNLRVEHDVVIKGKSGATHQIDVFWEFNAAGVTYRTCIECKNYKSAVKKSHVAAFSTILDDIGNANGIIATTSSFQKGAKLLAKDKNIRLILVNNILKSISITFHIKIPEYSNWQIEHDVEYARNLLNTVGLKSYEFNEIISGDHPLFNGAGVEAETFNTLLNKHNQHAGRNRIETKDLYIQSEIGMFLIKAISFDLVYLDSLPVDSTICVNNESKAVLEDIVNKNKYYLNDDGTVTQNNP